MMGVKSEKKPSRPVMIVEFPLMLLMSASMVYPFVTALELGQSILAILLINSVCLSIWSVAFRSAKTAVVTSAMLLFAGIAAAALYLTGVNDGIPTPLRENADAFLYWAGMYLSGYRTTNPQYATTMVFIFSAFVCLVVCLFTVRKFDALVVSLCGAGCFTALTIIGHIINIPSMFAYILAAMLYFLLQNYKKLAPEMRQSKAPSLPAYAISALPLAVFVLLLTMLFSSVMKIDPAWMKDTRDQLIKKNNTGNQTVTEFSNGYVVSSSELGGNLYLDGTVLLEVKSQTGNEYLRGISKDQYTGHSWIKTDTDPADFNFWMDKFKDTSETTEAMELIGSNGAALDELYRLNQVDIRYSGISTGILYLPGKTAELTSVSKLLGFRLVGSDTLMLTRTADKGFEYSVSYYDPMTELPEFIALAQSCHRGYYRECLDQGMAVDAGLIAQAEEIDSQYNQLPEELPGRVKALALDITKDAASDYDKAKAIESYLSQNFTYTLTPGAVDKSRDFVDQFLFEGKQGYCTYYATAMAVLLRCVNIPSRYVEGYVLPGSAAGGVYKVTKKEGHAWVEAYLEGLGWLAFEPTTTFTGKHPSTEPTATATTTTAPVPSAAPSKTPAATASSKPAGSSAAKKLDLTLPLMLLGIAALLAALLSAPYSAHAGMKRRKPRDAALRLFGQYMRLLALQGVMMQDGETSSAFAERVEVLLGFDGSEFKQATEIFQVSRYSEHEVTPEQKQKMLSFRKALLTASKRKLGLMRYLFYKYIWAI